MSAATGEGPVRWVKHAQHGEARTGTLHLRRHGEVPTPMFMPVGTLGPVKGLDGADMAALGVKLQLANAYHLLLRPGPERLRELGGLHNFASIEHGVLTDSGGFQVFSLAKSRSIDDDGVSFRSHLDGSLIRLTPERLVEVQEAIAPDIAMVLDECPPGQASREVIEAAMARTTAWAKRAVAARRREDIGWFGIVQGGVQLDLRERHLAELRELPWSGMAIGGVSVGEAQEEIARVVAHVAPRMPEHLPRYLMGVGTPADLIRGVAAGVDLFDCVMPSRNARNGTLFVRGGKISIKASKNQHDEGPIDASCSCQTCRRYSRAYLRHLFMARELTYFRLATWHNVAFYLALMSHMRAQIAAGTFDARAVLQEWAGQS